MIPRHRVEYWSSIIQILIDLCNLFEQLIIYFIVKEESNDQRLFFFVLLIIGLLSNLPSASPYLYWQTIGSITIEFGELLAYLFLLEQSTGVILVAFISFTIEFIFHSIHIILEYNSDEKEDNIFIFGKTTCGRIKYVVIRSISYSVFDATSILFLFLDQKSRFHHKFYEILILLTFYFPSIALGPALESTTKFQYQYEHNQIPQITILLIWSLFCATIYYIMYCVPLSITGILFAIQELNEINQLYGYDYFVYVSSLIFFSIAILVFPPFMIWWWKFTFQRFQTMRIDAKKRLIQINEDNHMQQCL
jgi:hypothetical protein